MLVTVQGERVMVTAYRYGSGVRCEAALLSAGGGLADASGLRETARELCEAARWIERLGVLMKEEGADGVWLCAVPEGRM